jgi:hypothetical protein
VLDVGDNGARLDLGASATGLGARAVLGPSGDLAVNGASLVVANARFGERAFVTTVLGSNDNVVVPRLLTGPARLRASGPGVPGVVAVDRARMSVAVLLSRRSTTSYPAVTNVHDNGLGAGLDTTTAKLGTG